MAYRKNKQMTVPPFRAAWAWLNEPDRKWDDDGKFRVTMYIDDEDTAHTAFVTELEQEWTEAAQWALDNHSRPVPLNLFPLKDEMDRDTKQPTGRKYLEFRLAHIVRPKGKPPWKKTVKIVDSQKRVMGEKVGSGSLIKAIIEVRPWAVSAAGASFDLLAVQVLELVSPGGLDLDAFGDTDDGFTSQVEAEAFDDKVDESAPSGAGGF